MNAAVQIAKHLEVSHWQIVKIEEWSKVWFAVIVGKGARFVSKKVVKMKKPINEKLSPNPFAFVPNCNESDLIQFCQGQQPYTIYDLTYADAKELVGHYMKLAKKVKRVYRGKIKEVEYSLETFKILLKGLLFRSSELEEGVVESIQNLTGWEYWQIQDGLNKLANEYFIERRMAVGPRQIIGRW